MSSVMFLATDSGSIPMPDSAQHTGERWLQHYGAQYFVAVTALFTSAGFKDSCGSVALVYPFAQLPHTLPTPAAPSLPHQPPRLQHSE